MRFAGQVFNKFPEQNDFSEADDYMKRIQGVERMRPEIQNPVVPGFNTEDLIPTPELPAGTPFNQNDKGRYIQQVPGSGISSVQGQQVALAPAVGLGINAIRAYGAYKTGKTIGETIRDPSSLLKGDKGGLGRVIGDMSDGKRERIDGPTLRSPYHQ